MSERNGERFTIDKGHNTPVYSPVCVFCAHMDPDLRSRTCAAFPDGIPLEIWRGLNDHTKPFAGDNGIRFQRVSVAP
jgi:hypothetical protein